MAKRMPDPEFVVKPEQTAPPAKVEVKPVPSLLVKGPDPHGAPARAERTGSGDEQVVAECLAALGRITDPASLQKILTAVQARVPTAPK